MEHIHDSVTTMAHGDPRARGRLQEAPKNPGTVRKASVTRLRMIEEGLGEMIRTLPKHMGHVVNCLQIAWVYVRVEREGLEKEQAEWQPPLL